MYADNVYINLYDICINFVEYILGLIFLTFILFSCKYCYLNNMIKIRNLIITISIVTCVPFSMVSIDPGVSAFHQCNIQSLLFL
jgi:hypothetical protein